MSRLASAWGEPRGQDNTAARLHRNIDLPQAERELKQARRRFDADPTWENELRVGRAEDRYVRLASKAVLG